VEQPSTCIMHLSSVTEHFSAGSEDINCVFAITQHHWDVLHDFSTICQCLNLLSHLNHCGNQAGFWQSPSVTKKCFVYTEVDTCCRLRSVSTSTLVVPSTRRSTVGDRAFPVAAARAWNSLPPSVRSTSSLASFCLHLNTHLFTASLPRWHSTPS